jgi:hypothetical protein
VFLKIIKWSFIVAIVTVVLISVFIINAPASLTPQLFAYSKQQGMIAEDSPQLEFFELSGTLWKGKAEKAVLLIGNNRLDLGQFSWKVDVVKILDRKIAILINSSAPGQVLQGEVSFFQSGEIEVKNAEGHFPVSLMEPWIPLLIQGKLAFVIDHWIFTPHELIALDGILNLEQADWLGGDKDMPLGSYMAQLSMEQENLHIRVNDFSATLGVNGLITVNSSSDYRFKAILQPREGLAPEVAESILWFGKRGLNGDILIDRRGRL